MRPVLLLVAAGAVCACSQAQTPAEKAAEDARAVKTVERLNTVPPVALAPQPITYSDIETNDLFGAGCYFLDGAGEQAPMLFLGSDEKGWLKLDGTIVALSSDRASRQLPYGAWTKYVGLAQTVTLTRDSAKERQTGPETATAPGSVVIRDAKDRVVFSRSGRIECGA